MRPGRVSAACLLLLALATVAGGATSAGRCRRTCRPAITACVATGNRRRACRHILIRQCRRRGVVACDTSIPATTTSTTMRVVTTTSSTTRTIVPSSTTTSSPSTTSTSRTTSITSTSSTSTTTSTLFPPWIDAGPLRWEHELPAQLPAGDTVQVALAVDVVGAEVSGRVLGCPGTVSPDECARGTATSPLEVDAPAFAAGPGIFTFGVRASLDVYSCTADAGAYLLAVVDVRDAGSDTDLGTFVSPVTRTTILARREARLASTPAALTFAAVAGIAVPPATISTYVYCTPGLPPRPTGLAARVDVPWLSVTATPNPFDDAFTVTADTATLDPGQSPYHATIHLTAGNVVNAPLDVPVTVYVTDLAARWQTPPPERVAAGSDVPLALEVLGDVARVDGSLEVCEVAGIDGCLLYDLEFDTPGGKFGGPPGVFSFVAHRPWDCRSDTDVEIRPFVTVTDHEGNSVGPFALPRALFTATASSEEEIEVQPTSLLAGVTIDLPDGAAVIPQDVFLRSSCRSSASPYAKWTGTADAPWLSLSRSQGTLFSHQYTEPDAVRLAIDPTLLPATIGPHVGTITIASPGTRNGPVTIPVTVRRHPEVQVSWTVPLPGHTRLALQTGDRLDFELAVTGDARSVAGTLDVCSEPVLPFAPCDGGEALGFDGGGAFAGIPGSFTLNGIVPPTCYQYGHHLIRARLVITPTTGDAWAPLISAPDQHIDRIRIGDPLTVEPSTLAIRGLDGQRPLVGTLRVQVPDIGCFNVMPWTVRTSEPWLTAVPPGGAIVSSGGPGAPVWVAADPAALDPLVGVHHADVVFDFPTGEVPTITVPVDVEIVAAPSP